MKYKIKFILDLEQVYISWYIIDSWSEQHFYHWNLNMQVQFNFCKIKKYPGISNFNIFFIYMKHTGPLKNIYL